MIVADGPSGATPIHIDNSGAIAMIVADGPSGTPVGPQRAIGNYHRDCSAAIDVKGCYIEGFVAEEEKGGGRVKVDEPLA